MNHSGKIFLGVLFLLLVLHDSKAEICPHLLEPTGVNTCFNGPEDSRLKLIFGKYECCPGWIRSGRSCSIRDPCPNGLGNCTDLPVGLVPKPTVTYGNNSALSNLEMVCSFDFPDWKNVSYKVEWLSKSSEPIKTETWCIPGQPANTQNDCNRRTSSIFLREDFELGDTVRCKLSMKFSTNKTNRWTKTGKESNKYYVGIEVSERQVVVKECNVGKNITVTLRPTVPILPALNVPGSNRVVVSVLIPQKYKAQRRQAAVDKCHVELKTEDITRGKTITIRGVCDNQQDQRQAYSFNFKPETSSPSWQGVEAYRMPSVQVTVDNTDTTLCYSTSDPNLFTFDDKKYFYNELGDYMMYNNEAKKIQVHIRLWKCRDDVTCICGAAIREGSHVIEISFCSNLDNSAPSMLRTVKRSHGRLARGIEIKKKMNGGSLDQEVTLSSGTRISVHRSGSALDVRVNAPATDKGRVSGLCGNFNGDPEDDIRQRRNGKLTAKDIKTFVKSWGVTSKESFFEILPEQEETEESDEERSCYCGIEGEEIQEENCDYNANIFTNIDATGIEVLTTQLNDQSQFGLKRSVDNHWYSDDIIDHVDRSYFVDDPQVQHVMNRMRSKRSLRTVMTRREARKYCNKHIKKSEAGNICKGISDTSINNAIIQCVNDLRYTGDKSFAVLAFDTMKYVCEDTALKSLSSYTHTTSGDLVPRKEVVKELCPSDCSEHGKCKNRTCICDKGFTALDCSMEVQAVPELLGIYNGGLCDVRERPCKKTNLLGQKFIDSSNLTCHVKEFEVFPSSWSPRGGPLTTHGKMIDIYGVKCDLPEPPTKLGDYDHEGTPAGGILVSISNDGFRTSAQELRQVTYDSKCMTCNKAGKCQRRANSCLIRGHCFAANEPNPRNWCQQCLPRDDQNSWTSRKNNQAPRFGRKPITYRALRGEDLVLQLKAREPDNRPVTYSLLSSTATGHTLSSSGLLRWKVTSNEKFTFKVIDECGAFDTTDMRVRIVQCPCLNAAQCVPHPSHPRGSGQYQCKCVNGFSGDRCEKPDVVRDKSGRICKANSCLIRGHCFAANEPNPRDWCKQCSPRDDQNSWTPRKNNQAPRFSRNPITHNALRGENLVIQLKATDPDNRPVTYSLLSSTATGHTISSSGLLRWKVTSNEKFTFKVTDECGAFDTTDMRVRIVQCPCLNGGQCVPHPYHPRGSGLYQCKCVKGFSGDRCEKPDVVRDKDGRICKANSCLIRGHCFAANEPNPRDWCKQCSPRDDQNSWTPRKNNQAPTFGRKPITYNALRGEDLVLQLKAREPDNRPVTYSLLSSTASGYTFNRAGQLRGKVTSNEKFTFKVFDECGAFDTTDLRVRIVQCPCLNGGQCVLHPSHPRGSGQYQCKCVKGFSGDRCENPDAVPDKSVPNASPVITSITPVRYDAMRVVWWSPVPIRQPNSFIKGYKIYYRERYTRKKWNVFTTSTGYIATTTVPGLKAYTEYCVKMSAFNSKGEYPDWERKQCYPVKTPSLPIKLSGQAVSRTAIRLRFQKPRRGPASNNVQVDYGKNKSRLGRKTACSRSSCVIENLEPNTLYYFKVIGYVYQRGETPSFIQIRTLA